MYMTLKQFSESYPWPTLNGIRKVYFSATKQQNTYLEAFSKVGRRVLVDPDKFFEIIDKKNHESGE